MKALSLFLLPLFLSLLSPPMYAFVYFASSEKVTSSLHSSRLSDYRYKEYLPVFNVTSFSLPCNFEEGGELSVIFTIF